MKDWSSCKLCPSTSSLSLLKASLSASENCESLRVLLAKQVVARILRTPARTPNHVPSVPTILFA